MKKIKKTVFAGLSALCAAILFSGCSQALLLEPKGPIGAEERFIILNQT